MLRQVLVVLCVLVVSAVVAASGGATPEGGPVAVVAAENVYGDIAAQIGGRWVRVDSILTNPNADPHLFEPNTRSGLAVAQARLIVQNGVGYDAFMQRLEQAAPNGSRVVVTVGDVLGVHGADANPHLWYDVPRLPAIAAAIAAALERVDASHAATYRLGLLDFDRSLRPLQREVAAIRLRFHGSEVAYTEPVPGYLLAAAGLRNVAPAGFTRAIEDGVDPTPQATAAMNVLISARKIRVLLYNSQTVTPLTQALRDEAHRHGIPVVPVSETLPPHLHFQEWQLAQARALAAALAR